MSQPDYESMSKNQLREQMIEAARDVLNSHCQEGCTWDLTVVDARPLARLQAILLHYAGIDAGESFEEDWDAEDADDEFIEAYKRHPEDTGGE